MGEDETKRVAALARHAVLDTPAEPIFDDITDVAALICDAPIALISFVDRERVWFKSKVGIDAEELPREMSFCAHGFEQKDVFVIPDASRDDRFKSNPLVTGEHGIRFYAGAPLRDPDGHALGMICVMDRQPRELQAFQKNALRALGRIVIRELEFRRRTDRLRELEGNATDVRLVRSMAARLLHELGNAVVPLSTHQQLLSVRYDDPDFRRSLDATLSEAVRRVLRLVSQMRHLAQVSDHAAEPVPLKAVIEAAYKNASRTPGVQPGTLRIESGLNPIIVCGDFAALTDAFGEIILNALQANPTNPEVSVECALNPIAADRPEVIVHVIDNGAGFVSEAMKDATQPFFSTRNVGPGLGLAVAKQVIERHHGSLEILPPKAGGEGSVRVLLPVQDGNS